jgi:hypothetical protein
LPPNSSVLQVSLLFLRRRKSLLAMSCAFRSSFRDVRPYEGLIRFLSLSAK